MDLEALPYVNWIFWAALTSGSLLVVGATELLGGTTRGYRLFMAACWRAVPGILLLSELNLRPGTVADETAGFARPGLGMAALTGAYLVASIVRLPRSGLALAAGSAGSSRWRRLPQPVARAARPCLRRS